MNYKFRVKAKFHNNACEDLDTEIHMGGVDEEEAEMRVIQHIVDQYENDYLDVESVQIEHIK